MAFRDDMMHASNLLDLHDEGPVIDYVAQFLGGVARAADDTPLLNAATALSEPRRDGAARGARLAQLAGLVQARLSNRAAM